MRAILFDLTTFELVLQRHGKLLGASNLRWLRSALQKMLLEIQQGMAIDRDIASVNLARLNQSRQRER